MSTSSFSASAAKESMPSLSLSTAIWSCATPRLALSAGVGSGHAGIACLQRELGGNIATSSGTHHHPVSRLRHTCQGPEQAACCQGTHPTSHS